jgi:hypothetical protein
MIDLPIISSAVYPKMRSAPKFQLVMILFKSLPMIASSDEATMAASRREVISERWRHRMVRSESPARRAGGFEELIHAFQCRAERLRCDP